jgi:hypothetical protein
MIYFCEAQNFSEVLATFGRIAKISEINNILIFK